MERVKISIYINKNINDKLVELSKEFGISKTALITVGINKYLLELKK